MTLKEYLSGRGVTQEKFAAAIGVDRFRVSKLVNGRINPGLSLAMKIERATGGLVRAETWLPRAAR